MSYGLGFRSFERAGSSVRMGWVSDSQRPKWSPLGMEGRDACTSKVAAATDLSLREPSLQRRARCGREEGRGWGIPLSSCSALRLETYWFLTLKRLQEYQNRCEMTQDPNLTRTISEKAKGRRSLSPFIPDNCQADNDTKNAVGIGPSFQVGNAQLLYYRTLCKSFPGQD